MRKSLLAISAIVALSSSAFALGTDAGTDISNSATLSYSAGGVAQPDVTSNTDTFKVDKKVDMVLYTNNNDQVEAAPGQEDIITKFYLKNEGNSNQYFKFKVANLANNEEADYNDKKDNNDVSNLEIQCKYQQADGTDVTTDWSETFTIEIKKDTQAYCEVRADMPIASTPEDTANLDGNIINIELKATAYKDANTVETETTGTDTQDGIDVVFADGESVKNGANSNLGNTSNSKGDTAGDGIELARSGYIIKTPVLSVKKSSCVISDPVNNTDNPKRIPGAIVRYMFDINNTGSADAQDANNIEVKDTFNDNLSLAYTLGTVKKDENVDSCDCQAGASTEVGSSDKSLSGQEVTIRNITVQSNKHTCITLEVEVE